MAQSVRPLMQWPRWHRYCCCRATLNHLLTQPSPLPSSTASTNPNRKRVSFFNASRNLHFRSSALRTRDIPPPDTADSESDSSDGQLKKSRNEKKREARRAVRWGMHLANFSPIQIKRICRVASLDPEVYDAVLLVKRLGRDVREAKRRQFNLIGKMLRDMEPELMDSLIQASKVGDKDDFENLFGKGSWNIKDDKDDAQEFESDDDEEDSQYYSDMAARWYDGLINKDIGITNEVYSLHGVEFDRQELRRLVKRVHSIQDQQISLEEKVEEIEAKYLRAKRSLTRFLRNLAKQIPEE